MDVSTGTKKSPGMKTSCKRIEMKDISEISGSRSVNGTETEAGDFV